MAAADSLGWRPSARGKSLSESRALAIGLILVRTSDQLASDPFFAQLLAGIEAELSRAGYVLVLSVVDEQTELEAYARLARDGRVDGVLLTDARPRIRAIGSLRSSGSRQWSSAVPIMAPGGVGERG